MRIRQHMLGGIIVMDKKFISDLKDKEKVDSVFILTKKNVKLTKYDKPYLEMTLGDRTGSMEARLWDDADKFNQAAETGDIVHIKGIVEKYRDDRQLKIDYIEKADEASFRFEDMVRVLENRKEMYDKVLIYLKEIKNKWISSLVEEFTHDEKLMSMFINGIGGKSWHNAYIGGLVEHTYEVMYIADKMCQLYSEADRDIVIFGSFIHDIGKVYELDPGRMEYTTQGGLIGHIAIGHKMLSERIKRIPDFPEGLSILLEHIVLSHHGEYEQQSPVLPKTLEATIVYHTDELVSQTNAVKELEFFQAGGGKEWTNFIAMKNRKYYIKQEY